MTITNGRTRWTDSRLDEMAARQREIIEHGSPNVHLVEERIVTLGGALTRAEKQADALEVRVSAIEDHVDGISGKLAAAALVAETLTDRAKKLTEKTVTTRTFVLGLAGFFVAFGILIIGALTLAHGGGI